MEHEYVVFDTAIRLKSAFSKRRRKKRMAQFVSRMGLKGGERVIDLGGTDVFWQDCPLPLDLTIVNLPGIGAPTVANTHHTITYLQGDACDISFASDNEFDIAFSNSVIEHVGAVEKQEDFARETHRVARRFWIQTPSIWFPIEAHNHMPFWWFYPNRLKQHFIHSWERKLPAWTEMIKGTTVILRTDLERMFPDATLWTERYLGFPKSYIVYRYDPVSPPRISK